MLRPRKMKYIELTVFKNDMDAVIEYLGKKAEIQFPETENIIVNTETSAIRCLIDRIVFAAEYLGEKYTKDIFNALDNENIDSSGKNKQSEAESLCLLVEDLKNREYKTNQEKQRLREAINETKAFSKMNVPFSDFEHLSYLTLRIGRLEPKGLIELQENIGDRAVIIPLDSDNRILAACSKKGRFALDSQLKKLSFEPVNVPENYRGIPVEMTKSLNEQFFNLDKELDLIKNEKELLTKKHAKDLIRLISSFNVLLIIEEIKARFTATDNLYHFSGWIPSDVSEKTSKDLSGLTAGRIAIHSYSPDEVLSIKSGKEKVPVAMKHNTFVKGFEGMVFSYGAPLYGTIDPTPVVAFFFTLMFGIMFGDVGQGFVLLLSGLLIKRFSKPAGKFIKYSTPLVAVGISSMIMGLLAGSVFTNEELLIAPTRAVTAAITGQPMDRILHILPLAGTGGSITKLLYFFGFTIAIGVIINSLGLIINIFNRIILKKYRHAFLCKTGLAGLLLFWYAIFFAVRLILGSHLIWFDYLGFLIPLFCIFFGPLIWNIITGTKPVLDKSIFTFMMEGFVEVLDTISTYLSNTISFLRVGAFALAHAVFSFIIFYFTDEVAKSGITGVLSAALIMIAGNAIIIVLEGLIVAIQVIRLQYYEFFNKFFIETGVEFAPFRFKHKE
ncbi:MAG: V-type ATP synthase subunit I [Treponema sp.]|nr:V-type ATP synthase subunit I [Treponema sp.]